MSFHPELTQDTRVHAAWLQEVLDLDVRGAVKAYDRISKRSPRNPMAKTSSTIC